MYTPEAWIECKKPCADCPMVTGEQTRDCRHIWRNIIDIAQKGGAITDTAVVLAYEMGATISDLSEVNGTRPSIQVYDFPPIPNEAYNQLRVERTEPNEEEPLSVGQLLAVYEMADGDSKKLLISEIGKIRSFILKLGINSTDEFLIEVATNGSADELLSVLATLLRDFDQSNDQL